MSNFDKIFIVLIVASILFGFKLWFTIFQENQEIQITNQNSIILLLSKDYPDIEIQKIKKSKARIKKLKELEKEIQKLLEN